MGLLSKIRSKVAERAGAATGSGMSTGTPPMGRHSIGSRAGQALTAKAASRPASKGGLMSRMRSRVMSKRGY